MAQLLDREPTMTDAPQPSVATVAAVESNVVKQTLATTTVHTDVSVTTVTTSSAETAGESQCTLSMAQVPSNTAYEPSSATLPPSGTSPFGDALDCGKVHSNSEDEMAGSPNASPASTIVVSYASDADDEASKHTESFTAPTKEYPVFYIRDFAYPKDDPRHHGDFSKPRTQPEGTDAASADPTTSACQSPTTRVSLIDLFQRYTIGGSDEQGDDGVDNDQYYDALSDHGYGDIHTLAQQPARVDSELPEVEYVTPTLRHKSSRQDEYTGPAKAIRDFCTEHPIQLEFKEGEEFWIRYQMEPGVLLAHKDGHDCHVREADVDFTNHS